MLPGFDASPLRREFAALFRKAAGYLIQNQNLVAGTTGGSGTAYTLALNPAPRSYVAGLSFWATLHTASGVSPTININNLGATVNLVYRQGDGTYSNVNGLPAGVYRITLIGATQALVENPPFAVSTPGNGPLGGSRNRIRNGGCRIAQEGNVAAVASTFTYGGADGHCVSVNGTLTGATIAQLNSGPSIGVQGFSQALSNATVTTAGSVYFQHRIEAKDAYDLNGKVVTISCKVYQDTGSSIATASLALLKPTTTADTHSAQTILQTSASQTVPSGVLTPLTFTTAALGAADASLGLAAQLIVPFGAAIISKNFTITDWQLEEGPIATKFDSQTPIGVDELRCKRTLECFQVGAIDFIGNNFQAGQNNSYTMPMKVQKRATPTAVTGAYTVVNAGAPTLSVGLAENVTLNVANIAAGQWRLTNNTVAKIRCDL